MWLTKGFPDLYPNNHGSLWCVPEGTLGLFFLNISPSCQNIAETIEGGGGESAVKVKL